MLSGAALGSPKQAVFVERLHGHAQLLVFADALELRVELELSDVKLVGLRRAPLLPEELQDLLKLPPNPLVPSLGSGLGLAH